MKCGECAEYKEKDGEGYCFIVHADGSETKLSTDKDRGGCEVYRTKQPYIGMPRVKKSTELPDSGTRREFSTGAVRDCAEDKGRCDLLPAECLLRVAKHYEAGARKYTDNNWKMGIPSKSFADSAMRHLLKYEAGEDIEDHLSGVIFNVFGLMYNEAVHPELVDIDERKGKRSFNYFKESK